MKPVPHARILVQLVGREPRTIAEGMTDDRGRFRVDLSRLRALPFATRVGATLEIGAETDERYATPRWFANPPRDDRPSIEWDVHVEMSTTPILTGRVVDAAGHPVAGATVWTRDNRRDEWSHGACDLTDAHGHFRLTEYWSGALCATHPTGGVSTVARYRIADDDFRRIDFGDVALEPVGEISGVVTYPDGSPARWLPIEVVATDRDESRRHRGIHRGLESAETETDAEGRFHVRCLARNRAQWRIATPELGARTTLATQPLDTHATPLRFARRRVLVRPIDADAGSPARAYLDVHAWHAGAAVRARDRLASGADLAPLHPVAFVSEGTLPDRPSGIVSVAARPDDFVLASVVAPGLERFVRGLIVTEAWETVLDVPVERITRPARLDVTAAAPDGSAVPVWLSLRDAVTGDHVFGYAEQDRAAEHWIAPGRYVLRADPYAVGSVFRAVTRPLTLHPGVNPVRLRLAPGGELHVRLRTVRELPESTFATIDLLDLGRPDATPERTGGHCSFDGSVRDGRRRVLLDEGDAREFHELSPGPHRLDVALYATPPDGATRTPIVRATRRIDVRTGEITHITIDL